ncbi:DNA alkylation repair protein [Labilibacter sediminis]|nr:DNA alkylation repair protein [Labilibacter sediminis]
MKFFLQDDTSEKVEHILGELKKLMDGDVSFQMKQKGVAYQKNYGASILWLRKVAAKYKYDNKLADRLWHRQIRETMILATMIAEPAGEIKHKIEDWSKMDEVNEVAEHLGVNLLSRFSDLHGWAKDWLISDSEWKQAAIWAALAAFLQKGGDADKEQVEFYLKLLAESGQLEGMFMMRVRGRFLRQLCRKSNEKLKLVEELLTQYRQKAVCAWLVEDVQTEIDYLKA